MAASPEKVWRARQRRLNKCVKRLDLLDVSALEEDGVPGPATRKRIRQLKHWLGYSAKKQTGAYDRGFHLRVLHPFSSKHSSEAMLKAAAERRHEHNDRHRESEKLSAATSGVATFDGKRVAAWLVPYLEWAREHGWKGQLVSGWRDPVRSEQLCREICGQPSCPGRCAGRSSNHSGSTKPQGAIDVSRFVEFGQLMRRCPHNPRIFNALGARDPVHFSATGR
ncbi:MAG TPA: hypothetical protein VF712_18475 [Thermoleophilaceae bacterium]|jgi:hypothetical protein